MTQSFASRLIMPLARKMILLLVLFSFTGQQVLWADSLPDLGESARAVLSPQMERRIGESIMNEIRLREPSYVDDQEISDYLNNLGRRLVEASPSQAGDFYFFAIQDNSINAFAMFGGFIGVNTGTILAAQSESELAGVVAHEIAHVTQNHLARQITREKQNTIPALIALAVGVLAARANSSVAAATIVSTQAGMIQAQLAYSRDFEREADRVGYQYLERAGFDVRGMGDFFERLQKAGRLYEINAPVYLRSHPLTLERISDIQNRAESSPYKQIVSGLDFHLVRAKIKAQAGTAREAVKEFEIQLQEKKYASEASARYGLVIALMRAGDLPRARQEFETLKAFNLPSPMISGLEANIQRASGNTSAAQATLREALQRFPQAKSLVYAYAELLYTMRQYEQVLKFIEERHQSGFADFTLYGLQAKTYAAMGKRMQQHRAQAEFYYLQGQLGAAIEQLNFAQQAKDGDFYEQSVVDARLREFRRLQMEEERLKKEGGSFP